jgi:hypothetical protein
MRRFGWFGTALLTFVQLLSGDTDTLGDTLEQRAIRSKTTGDKIAHTQGPILAGRKTRKSMHLCSERPPTSEETQQLKRELTENCVVSEMMTSAVLLVLVATDMALDKTGGDAFVTQGMSQAQRGNALKIYAIIMFAQVLGICLSHQIIRHKNSITEHMHWLAHRKHIGPMPMGAGLKYHFFLSHMQSTAGDAVHSLCLELQKRGMVVWYDQVAEDLTKGGMQAGVQQSDVFVLFLTQGTMSRPFVHLELREAVKHGKKILLLHEQDPRHHAANFGEERAAAPTDLQHIFDDCESLVFGRRHYLRAAMLSEMMKRAGPEYVEYVNRAEHATAAAITKSHRVSCVSVDIAWFDNLKWLRIAIATGAVLAAIFSAKNFRQQLDTNLGQKKIGLTW